MKSKKVRITVDILLIIIGVVFLIFGIKDAIEFFTPAKVEDGVKFNKDYNTVSAEEAVFKYVSLDNLEKTLDKENAIVLVGNPLDPWVQVLVKPLNDALVSLEKEAYYYEEKEENKEHTSYKNIMQKLEIDSFITPTIIVIKNKEITILDYNSLYDSSFDGLPVEYWNEERTDDLKSKLN